MSTKPRQLETTDRQLATIVLVLLGALLVLPALLMGVWMLGFGGFGPMMGGTWGHGTWGADGAMPWWLVTGAVLVQLLFLVALVAGGYLIYRRLQRSASRDDPALEELRMAFARGDLTEEEYQSRRDRLEREA